MKKTILALSTLSVFACAGGDLTPAVEPEVVVPVVLDEENTGGLYASLGIVYSRVYATNSAWLRRVDTQDQVLAVSGSLGYEFNKYLAAEGRITKSFYQQDYADLTAYSLFLKPQYPISEKMDIYALLGYGLVQVKGTTRGTVAATPGASILNQSGFQWGLGLSYVLNDKLDIFMDYTRLRRSGRINSRLTVPDANVYTELNVDALTTGMIYHF